MCTHTRRLAGNIETVQNGIQDLGPGENTIARVSCSHQDEVYHSTHVYIHMYSMYSMYVCIYACTVCMYVCMYV